MSERRLCKTIRCQVVLAIRIANTRLHACLARLGNVFQDTSLIRTSVPAYLGGPFVFAWGCDDVARIALTAQELAARPVPAGLRCYTPAVHAAAFVHPHG